MSPWDLDIHNLSFGLFLELNVLSSCREKQRGPCRISWPHVRKALEIAPGPLGATGLHTPAQVVLLSGSGSPGASALLAPSHPTVQTVTRVEGKPLEVVGNVTCPIHISSAPLPPAQLLQSVLSFSRD